jgi:outer membrane lipoprotein carrier protein
MSSTRPCPCVLLLLCMCLALLAPVAQAAPTASTREQHIVLLQKKYHKLRSLEFEFFQTVQSGGRLKQGNGSAIFFRAASPSHSPGTKQIMRWNYSQPIVQTILNDGITLSIYTPQDKQLLVSPLQDIESDITYALFSGTKKLLDAFIAAPGDSSLGLSDPPAQCEAILLTPRHPHPQVKRVQLWLNREATIQRLVMEDHFEAITELTFTQVRFDRLGQGDAQQTHALLKLDLEPGTETIQQ